MADWVALDYRGHLRPGETVLILGAGGTAGQLAVQPARLLPEAMTGRLPLPFNGPSSASQGGPGCHERREEVIDGFFDLADTITTVRSPHPPGRDAPA